MNQACISQFQELKLKKKNKYIIYTISKDLEIVILKESSSNNYDDLISELPPTECRYAIYDFEYELPGGEGKRNKICFFSWSVVKRG